MTKQITVFIVCIFSASIVFGQQLGEFFEVDDYAFHSGVDSIITTNYMVSGDSYDEPDLIENYDGKEVALGVYDRSKLIYDGKLAYTTKRYLHNELTKVESLTFNEAGQQLSYKIDSYLSPGKNAEKTYTYDNKGRLIKVVSVGYHIMEYEAGDSTIHTDTTFEMNYGKNNLVNSASTFIQEMGMSFAVETEEKNDTVFYTGEMKMSAEMLEMMGDRGGPASNKRPMMYLVKNKVSDQYEAYEKGRGGMMIMQVIDKEGRTVELKKSLGDKITQHDKYGYKGYERTSVDSQLASDGEGNNQYNEKGQLSKETTYEGTKLFEYDDKGNLVKEFSVNPYTTELTDLTVHKIYYSK